MRQQEKANSERQKEATRSYSREEGIMFNEYIGSVMNDGKVFGIDKGDGNTTLWMYLMPLNCTITNG